MSLTYVTSDPVMAKKLEDDGWRFFRSSGHYATYHWPHATWPADPFTFDCENCIGMPEAGCYCAAVGAVAPGGPLRDQEGT